MNSGNVPEDTRTFDGASQEIPPAQLAEITLPGYEVHGVLGSGGMGVVYRATEVATGRTVAVKRIRSGSISEADRERVLQEARIAASLSHPGIVFVFSVESWQGDPVIIMEFCQSGTLRDYYTLQQAEHGGYLPVERVVDITLQLAHALSAAHQAGILHRDLKPSNCFVSANGHAKIGDFGLARTAERAGKDTQETGSFRGTPTYASPQQLEGKPLDERSDIYSLGGVLYYLLTGREPFEKQELIPLIAAVMNRMPESPQKIRPSLPPQLSEIAMKCLAKDPAARYANCQELIADLETLQSEYYTPVLPPLRVIAGWLNSLAAMPLLALLSLAGGPSHMRAASTAGSVIVTIVFGLTEGVWGRSAGHAVLGLRVLRKDYSPLGPWRGLLRSMLFHALPILNSIVFLQLVPDLLWASIGSWAGYLLFVTIRRSNSWSGLHDLAVGAVVLQRRDARPLVAKLTVDRNSRGVACAAERKFGPYQAVSQVAESKAARVYEGSDLQLQRPVWIVEQLASTHPLPMPSLRAQRLAAGPGWAAFEHPAGMPWVDLGNTPVDWDRLRVWLLQLCEELVARPDAVLDTGRIWISQSGDEAALLDFPLVQGTVHRTAAGFLSEVAGRVQGPIPLHAHELRQRLPSSESVADVLQSLRAIRHRETKVNRGRIAGLVIAGVFATLFPLLLLSVGVDPALRTRPDERKVLTRSAAGARPIIARYVSASDLELVDRHLAAQYRNDPSFRRYVDGDDDIAKEFKAVLQDKLTSQPLPPVAPQALAAAKSNILAANDRLRESVFVGLMAAGVLPLVIGIVILLAMRNHLSLLAIDSVLVDAKTNERASRLRLLLRRLVVLIPFGLALVSARGADSFIDLGPLSILALGTVIWMLLRPFKGPAEWLTRTVIVRR
ncbi:hypothetical protein F183_A17700 [Bryobacterales bacterium F-183]|nr:hypothetical protein F183_A17700 [Bryobacterales bacterium F-183]